MWTGRQGVNLQTNDLIKHNLVVFNGGEGALKTLPSLVDVIPEARLNLVSYCELLPHTHAT